MSFFSGSRGSRRRVSGVRRKGYNTSVARQKTPRMRRQIPGTRPVPEARGASMLLVLRLFIGCDKAELKSGLAESRS
jgi:hypothetical protein